MAVDSMAGDATPSRPRRFGLRAKFLILVSVGFIVSGLVFRWVFSSQFEHMLRLEFQKRGETLARGLAASGRLDLWAGNKERLTRLVESAREEADVVAASVYNVRRELLARSEKIRGAAVEQPPPVPRAGVVVDSRRLPSGERALALIAPVELVVDVARPADDPLALFEGQPRQTRSEVLGAVEVVVSLSDVEQRLDSVENTTLAITSGIVGVGIVLVLLLSRVFVSPIERIAATARRIAAGDRSSRARVGSRDELGDLADAFNTMTTTLSER
ncbi:MAG: HAMP domain-containing protein, partial [Candidatus Binatia bacterium]